MATKKTAAKKLDHHDMLQAEFEYISNSAFQANEDRSRVTSFYFVTVGSLVAAILGTRLEEIQGKGISLAFFVLFLVLTAMGWLTLAQLARLRAAWHEAAEAMNQIKDFYIDDNPVIAAAFKWRIKQIPPMNKPFSIANLIAYEVVMLGGLTAGAGVYFLMAFIGNIDWLGWAIILASVFVGSLAQWNWYKSLLVDNQ
ncbi:MAG: hypothetical protein HYZ23_00690 [Chloroflexi bacterium]|nr:hypothetical protein [Chloroflexota bacterium]